jgi:hypothetical protein
MGTGLSDILRQKFANIGVKVEANSLSEKEFEPDHYDLLVETYDALVELKRKGFPIPGILQPLPDVEKGNGSFNTHGHTRGTLSMGVKGKMVYTPGTVDWSIRGAVIHECGHLYHWINNKTFYENTPKELKYYLDDDDLQVYAPVKAREIVREVSAYASTNAKEFVAEVFTGHFNGKRYSEKIMTLFHIWCYAQWNSGKKI